MRSTTGVPESGNAATLPRASRSLVEGLKALSWFDVLDGMGDGVILHSLEGRIRFANRAAAHCLGYQREDLLALTCTDLISEPDPEAFPRHMETLRRDQVAKHFTVFRHKGGKPVRSECVSNLVSLSEEPVVVTVLRFIAEENAEQLPWDKANEELRTYREILRTTTDGFWKADMQGRILEVNDAYCRMIGMSRDEVVGRQIAQFDTLDKPEDVARRILKIKKFGHDRFRSRHRHRDGSELDVEISVSLDGTARQMVVFARDITAQILDERMRDLNLAVLEVLNQHSDWKTALRVVINQLRQKLDLPVVALRLREGDDFPYFVEEGLDATAAEADCSLCAHARDGDPRGEPLRDEDGHARLACACGMVLKGVGKQALPFFSPDGSFWTNRLGSAAAELQREHPAWFERGFCSQQEFQSLALIPLRTGTESLGILQLADPRPDRFSRELVHYLEGIATSIGMAVARKRAEDAVTHYLKFQMGLLDHFPVIVWRCDRKGAFNYLNETAREFFGWGADVQLTALSDAVHPDDRERVFAERARGNQVHQDIVVAYRLLHADGSWRRVIERASPFEDLSGEHAGLIGAVIDETEASEARNRLVESEERFRLFFDAMVEGVALLELVRDDQGRANDYRVVDVNPAFTRHTGFTRDRVFGRTAVQILGSAPYVDVFADVATTNSSFSFETHMEQVGLDLRLEAFALPEGRLAVMVEDITERRNIERAVRQSEQMFRQMVDLSPIAIQLFDRTGRLVHANRAAYEIQGIADPQVLADYNLFADPMLPSSALEQLERGESTGFEVPVDFTERSNRYRSVRRGKAHFEMIVTVLESMPLTVSMSAPAADPLPGDAPRGALLVQILDVTDRWRVEETLKRYEMLTTLARDIILLLRQRDGRIVEANHAAVEAYGYSREELLGLAIRDLRAVSAPAADWEHPLQERGGFLYETVHKRRDGTTFPVEVSATGIDLDGERFLLAIVRNIAERRRTEKTLLQTEKLAALGRLAAATAHEMNQPLNAIKNYCQGILLNIEEHIPTSEERLKQNLGGAISQVDRMAEIIRNMRIFARQDEPGLRHPLSLKKVLAYPGTFLAAQFANHGIDLVEEIPDEEITVLGHESRLQQVFINLMINARDSIQEWLAAHKDERGLIQVRLSAEAGMAVVTVADNGGGVGAEDRERLFEPFFTTKDTERGTGLGLSICYEIIHQHGGTIRVEDAPVRGAVFRVEIPLWQATRDAGARAESGWEGMD